MPAFNQQPGTDNLQPATPKRFTCRHIFHDGHRCGSPALRGDRTFCYYHRSTPRPDPPAPSTDPEIKFAGPLHAELLLPMPEDRAAIQTGIGLVLRALGTNRIDAQRARHMLFGLQVAARNLPPHPRVPQHAGSQASNLRPGSTTSNSAANQQPTTSNQQPTVDDIEDSALYGPLAPVAEYVLPESESESEEEREPSLAQIIDAWIKSPPDPEPVPLEKRPYDFDTLQLLRRTLATTTNPETAARIRKALEEEALIPGHNLHLQAAAEEPRVPQIRQSHRRLWEHSLLDSPELSPIHPPTQTPQLQHRCRAIRRGFLPRSSRPQPATSNLQPATLPILHAVARPKVLRLSPMFSRTYRKKFSRVAGATPCLRPRPGAIPASPRRSRAFKPAGLFAHYRDAPDRKQ